MAVQQIAVSGRNLTVGEALSQQVTEQMTVLSRKYFGHIVNCRVVFAKDKGNTRTCTIQVTVARNMHFVGTAATVDAYACFRQAYEHVAKQLRRHKRALHEDKPDSQKQVVLETSTLPEETPPNAVDVFDVVSSDITEAVESFYGVRR